MADEALARGLLDGVVVLDFTHVLSGPFATMILADMGARVIKIESPRVGDTWRWEGGISGGALPLEEGMSLQFATVNRGKYGVVLDLKSPDGLAAAVELAKKADVVVNNYRPGVMERLGLGADVLREANPRLIFAQISGFGQSGPLSRKPALDPVVQAMSGLMSLNGDPDGPPGRSGLTWGDLTAGVMAAFAVVAALYDRQQTGTGQVVDVAMFDGLFFMLGLIVPSYQATGRVPRPAGSFVPRLAPVGTYPTADGYIEVCPTTQTFWKSFCRALGRPEWIEDPRYSDLAGRQANFDELISQICALTRARSTAEWAQLLTEHDVPFGEIQDIADLMKFPLVHERELLGPLGIGDLTAPLRPFRLSGSDQAIRKPAPGLGADTYPILRELLGFTDDRIARAMGDLAGSEAAATESANNSAE